jgi:hypothetical protein
MVDHNQIGIMLETGIPVRHVARRLTVSERHVIRIKQKYNLKQGRSLAGILGTPEEHELWAVWFESLGSYSAVAYRFGVSRQAVFGKLNHPCPTVGHDLEM